MKLSACIELLEEIRKSKGGDIEVFVPHANGESGRGLSEMKPPISPVVIDIYQGRRWGDGLFVTDKRRFEKFESQYSKEKFGVRLGERDTASTNPCVADMHLRTRQPPLPYHPAVALLNMGAV